MLRPPGPGVPQQGSEMLNKTHAAFGSQLAILQSTRLMQEGWHALPGHSTGLQAHFNSVFEEEQAHPSVLFMPQRSLCADIPFLKTVWIHGKYPDCFPKDKQARVTLVVQMPLKLKQKCLDIPHK